MPILLEDDQFVGRLKYFNMSEKPNKIYGGLIGSNYQYQGLTLSKQFKRQLVNFDSIGVGRTTEQTNSGAANEGANDAGEDPEDDLRNVRVNFGGSQASFDQWVHAKS